MASRTEGAGGIRELIRLLTDDETKEGEELKKALLGLEEKDNGYRVLSEEAKRKRVKRVEEEIKLTTGVWAEVSGLAALAGKGDFVTPEEASYLIRAALRIVSLWDFEEKGVLATAIEGWVAFEFSSGVTALENFLWGEKRTLFIYDAYRSDFEARDWKLIARHYGNEAALRSAILDRLHLELLKLVIVSEKSPYTSQISDLKAKIAEMEEQRAELSRRMELRQRFFAARRARILEMMRAKGMEVGDREEEEGEELARREADGYLRMLSQEGEGDAVAYRGGRVFPTARGVGRQREERRGERGRGGVIDRWKQGILERAERYREAREAGGSFWGGLKGFFGRRQVVSVSPAGGALVRQAGARAVASVGIGGLLRAGAWGAALKLGLTRLVGILTGPVGWAVTLLSSKTGRKILAAVGAAAYLLLVKLAAAIVSAGAIGVGVLIGAGVGAFLVATGVVAAPLMVAILGGAVVGGAIGWLGGQVYSALQAGVASGVGATLAGASAALSTVGSTVMATLTGSSAAAMAVTAVGGAFLATGILATAIQGQINEAFRSEPTVEYGEQHGEEALIGLKKVVDKDFVDNDSGESVVYAVTMAAGKERDVSVEVRDTLTRLGGDGSYVTLAPPETEGQWPKAIAKGEVVTVRFKPYKILPEFNNSQIVNTVSVLAKTSDGKSDEQKASVVTQVGKLAIFDQPYGYPAGGTIPALDYKFGELNRIHNGTFLNTDGSRSFVNGGIDILGAAGTPVYSTLEGAVEYADFDWGQKHDPVNDKRDRNRGECDPEAREKLCKNAVGAAVIVRSKTPGRYRVAFLHLDEALKVKEGDIVARGQQLGVTYGGRYGVLPSTLGKAPWHVHYQILLNGGNVFFESPSAVGLCRDGKVIPKPLPHLGGVVTSSQLAPRTCN